MGEEPRWYKNFFFFLPNAQPATHKCAGSRSDVLGISSTKGKQPHKELFPKQFPFLSDVLIIILGSFPMWCVSPDSSLRTSAFRDEYDFRSTMKYQSMLHYPACVGLKWQSEFRCILHGSLHDDFIRLAILLSCTSISVAICTTVAGYT